MAKLTAQTASGKACTSASCFSAPHHHPGRFHRGHSGDAEVHRHIYTYAGVLKAAKLLLIYLHLHLWLQEARRYHVQLRAEHAGGQQRVPPSGTDPPGSSSRTETAPLSINPDFANSTAVLRLPAPMGTSLRPQALLAVQLWAATDAELAEMHVRRLRSCMRLTCTFCTDAMHTPHFEVAVLLAHASLARHRSSRHKAQTASHRQHTALGVHNTWGPTPQKHNVVAEPRAWHRRGNSRACG